MVENSAKAKRKGNYTELSEYSSCHSYIYSKNKNDGGRKWGVENNGGCYGKIDNA